MDRLSVIREVETSIPENILDSIFIHNNRETTLRVFLEKDFIKFVSDGADPKIVAQVIEEKIMPSVRVKEDIDLDDIERISSISEEKIVHKSEKEKIAYIEEFIKNRVGYVDEIRMSENEFISTRAVLMDKVSFMDDEFQIQVGPNRKSISQFYEVLLNNSYKAPTIVDKTEICMYYASMLDETILSSIMDGMNISVRKYLEEVLPTKMTTSTDIVIDGQTISIDEAIGRIAEHQQVLLDTEKRKEIEAKEQKFNRTSENPSLLEEISFALSENNKLEITSPLPIVTSGDLDEEEIENLYSTIAQEIKEKEHYREVLDLMRRSISSTNSLHDLENVENYFTSLAKEALACNLGLEIQVQIQAIEELLIEKKNSIIKFEGNKEDYIEAIQDRIATLTHRIKRVSSMDDLSIIYGEIKKLEIEVCDRGIKDYQLRASLVELNEKYRFASAKYEFNTTEFEQTRDKAIATIEDLFSDLRIKGNSSFSLPSSQRDIQNISIGLNVKEEQIKNALAEYLRNKLITDAEYEKYNQQLEELHEKYNKDNKIGFGLG